MARRANPAPKPAIAEIFDDPDPRFRLHYYDRPGGGWTFVEALARTINEITVHYSEQHTPDGKPADYYRQLMHSIANYHAFDRDWLPEAPGLQGGDGFMYHYAIDPTGQTWQTTPETHRTWNAFEANSSNIAICLLAGHGDPIYPAMVGSLRALLAWFVTGRDDLPLVTAHAESVLLTAPDGHSRSYRTAGVLTHDESLIAHGRSPKGCPGQYAAIVKQWRDLVG